MSSSPTSPSDLEAQPEKLSRFRRHVTIEERELSQQPTRRAVEMVPRLTGEFRTLSIHVETHTSPVDADTGAIRKAAVKGVSLSTAIVRASAESDMLISRRPCLP